MKSSLLPLACALLASASAAAPPKATFKYTPPADGEDERPVIVDATLGPQGSDFAMRLRFDKEPWGEQCASRCANAIVYLDTDSNNTTGMQLGKKAAETGADMAVVVQGARDYRGETSITFLRVKVRQLTNETKSWEDGEALADLDHRQDPERVQTDGNTVYLLIDATSPTLPSARKVRVIYRPPTAKPIQATIAGMLSGGSSATVRIFRGGSKKGWGKAKEAGTPASNSVSPPPIKNNVSPPSKSSKDWLHGPG